MIDHLVQIKALLQKSFILTVCCSCCADIVMQLVYAGFIKVTIRMVIIIHQHHEYPSQ